MDGKELQLSKTELVQNKNDSETSSVLQREWQAVALGFSDGIARSGSTTGRDLKAGATAFVDSPVSTTTGYLKEHWQDAAVGAAITFLRPSRWANAAIVAYSLRGAGVATYDTAVGALDPKADVAKLRSNYAEEISHQGSAFISSMPLALLGGNMGRAGANAVFGKNLGALDLVSGKVSLAEVKGRLWDIHDTLRPPSVKLVITDMDNTLGAHGRYFAEGVKKGLAEMSAKTKIPEQELYTKIGQEMENYRSHDYPWSVEIALKDRLKVGQPGGMSAVEFENTVVRPFWDTIEQSLKQNHKPYPGVVETLAELKRREIPVAVLSDAPAFVGLHRLMNLGLDRAPIERFYGLHNWKEPAGLPKELLAEGHKRVEAMLNAPNGLKEVRAIPAHWEKPDVNGFEALMRAYNVRPKEVLMVGDSRVKDVGVAHKAGSRGVWAEYGQASAADEAVLTRLRPLPEHSGGVSDAARSAKKYAPYLEAAPSYDRLLSYLNPKADYSQIGTNALQALKLRPEIMPAAGAYAVQQPETNKK